MELAGHRFDSCDPDGLPNCIREEQRIRMPVCDDLKADYAVSYEPNLNLPDLATAVAAEVGNDAHSARFIRTN